MWNVACDLVVNEFLLEQVGFSRNEPTSWKSFLSSAITFGNTGLSIAAGRGSLTAEEAYDLLVTNLSHVQVRAARLQACDEHPWNDGDGGDGTGQRDGDRADDSGDDTAQGDADQEEPEASEGSIDEVEDRLRQIFHNWMPGWSPCGCGELRQVLSQRTAVVDWERVLARRIEDSFQVGFEQRWSPPSRKIAWMFPRVLLPAERELERPRTSVLLAVDASGSISPETLSRFLALARSIPAERADVSVIIFDTVVHEVDLRSPPVTVPGGGGTSFQCIEDYAAKLQKYPGLIVVLTDGLAPTPQVRHPARWFWLVTEDGTYAGIQKVGTSCRIAEVTR